MTRRPFVLIRLPATLDKGYVLIKGENDARCTCTKVNVPQVEDVVERIKTGLRFSHSGITIRWVDTNDPIYGSLSGLLLLSSRDSAAELNDAVAAVFDRDMIPEEWGDIVGVASGYINKTRIPNNKSKPQGHIESEEPEPETAPELVVASTERLPQNDQSGGNPLDFTGNLVRLGGN